MYHRIVVGFDGSDSSRRALQEAARLAKLAGAEVLVTMVEEHLPKYPSAMSETTEEREAIGASGRSGLWAGVLGGTADKVVDHAPCSVLVMRAWKP